MVDKFGEKCVSLNLVGNSSPKMIVKKACEYIKDNWDESKSSLLNMILDIQNDTCNGSKISDEERIRLVSYLSESIDNLSLQVSGKGNQCRYSSHAVNLAMCLFLKSKNPMSFYVNKTFCLYLLQID